MDRMFRSASNALQVIEDFKKRAANKDARCPVDSGQQAAAQVKSTAHPTDGADTFVTLASIQLARSSKVIRRASRVARNN